MSSTFLSDLHILSNLLCIKPLSWTLLTKKLKRKNLHKKIMKNKEVNYNFQAK